LYVGSGTAAVAVMLSMYQVAATSSPMKLLAKSGSVRRPTLLKMRSSVTPASAASSVPKE
jgi:hypothetical protein